jgi:hypothetical protein
MVGYVKAQRVKWLGIIQRMDQTKPTRKLFYWKSMGTRPVGRPITAMARGFYGRFKKDESKRLEGNS